MNSAWHELPSTTKGSNPSRPTAGAPSIGMVSWRREPDSALRKSIGAVRSEPFGSAPTLMSRGRKHVVEVGPRWHLPLHTELLGRQVALRKRRGVFTELVRHEGADLRRGAVDDTGPRCSTLRITSTLVRAGRTRTAGCCGAARGPSVRVPGPVACASGRTAPATPYARSFGAAGTGAKSMTLRRLAPSQPPAATALASAPATDDSPCPRGRRRVGRCCSTPSRRRVDRWPARRCGTRPPRARQSAHSPAGWPPVRR